MVFENLPAEAQDFVLFSTLQNMKVFLLLAIVVLSAMYLFVWKKQEGKTAFWSVGFSRFFMTIVAYVSLLCSPLMMLFISPEVSFWVPFALYGSLYFVVAMLFLVAILADINRIIPIAVLKMAGMNVNDPKVSRAIQKFMRVRILE